MAKSKKTTLLVLGSSGFLGTFFTMQVQKDFHLLTPSHNQLDVLNPTALKTYCEKNRPSIIINFVALADVNKAEKEKNDKNGQVYKLNSIVPQSLGEIAHALQIHLVHVSTDCVFDGKQSDKPYQETDTPSPINWYGQTKLIGEQLLLSTGASYSIARIEMAYTSDLEFNKKSDFARYFFQGLSNSQKIEAIIDQKITPTFMEDIIESLMLLVQTKNKGIFHIGSTDWISPYDFALELAQQAKFNTNLVQPVNFKHFSQNRAPRAQYPWLDTSLFQQTFGKNILHTNKESIARFIKSLACNQSLINI